MRLVAAYELAEGLGVLHGHHPRYKLVIFSRGQVEESSVVSFGEFIEYQVSDTYHKGKTRDPK